MTTHAAPANLVRWPRSLAVAFALAAAILPGCRQPDAPARPKVNNYLGTSRDVGARRRITPGAGTGLSDTSREVERNLGF